MTTLKTKGQIEYDCKKKMRTNDGQGQVKLINYIEGQTCDQALGAETGDGWKESDAGPQQDNNKVKHRCCYKTDNAKFFDTAYNASDLTTAGTFYTQPNSIDAAQMDNKVYWGDSNGLTIDTFKTNAQLYPDSLKGMWYKRKQSNAIVNYACDRPYVATARVNAYMSGEYHNDCVFNGWNSDTDKFKCCLAGATLTGKKGTLLDPTTCMIWDKSKQTKQVNGAFQPLNTAWAPWTESCVSYDKLQKGGVYSDYCGGYDEQDRPRVLSSSSNTQCQAWCTQQGEACDNIKTHYCLNENPTDPLCACMNLGNADVQTAENTAYNDFITNLPPELKVDERNPICWWPKCFSNDQIMTHEMKKTQTADTCNAVDINICKQIIDATAGGDVIIKDNTFNQTCNFPSDVANHPYTCNTGFSCKKFTPTPSETRQGIATNPSQDPNCDPTDTQKYPNGCNILPKSPAFTNLTDCETNCKEIDVCKDVTPKQKDLRCSPSYNGTCYYIGSDKKTQCPYGGDIKDVKCPDTCKTKDIITDVLTVILISFVFFGFFRAYASLLKNRKIF